MTWATFHCSQLEQRKCDTDTTAFEVYRQYIGVLLNVSVTQNLKFCSATSPNLLRHFCSICCGFCGVWALRQSRDVDVQNFIICCGFLRLCYTMCCTQKIEQVWSSLCHRQFKVCWRSVSVVMRRTSGFLTDSFIASSLLQ